MERHLRRPSAWLPARSSRQRCQAALACLCYRLLAHGARVSREPSILATCSCLAASPRICWTAGNAQKGRSPNQKHHDEGCPTRDSEVAACRPFLEEQIRLISPKVIVTLGAFAAQAVLGTEAAISQLRGRWQLAHGARVMPTYHPAFLLRSPKHKKEVWEDMRLLLQRMGRPVPR